MFSVHALLPHIDSMAIYLCAANKIIRRMQQVDAVQAATTNAPMLLQFNAVISAAAAGATDGKRLIK